MKRYSLVYLLNDQHQHIGFVSHAEAVTVMEQLLSNPKRQPIGIYDAKTEPFQWSSLYRLLYNQAGTEEQAQRGNDIISITQALRRLDASWHPADGFRRPSFFA